VSIRGLVEWKIERRRPTVPTSSAHTSLDLFWAQELRCFQLAQIPIAGLITTNRTIPMIDGRPVTLTLNVGETVFRSSVRLSCDHFYYTKHIALRIALAMMPLLSRAIADPYPILLPQITAARKILQPNDMRSCLVWVAPYSIVWVSRLLTLHSVTDP